MVERKDGYYWIKTNGVWWICEYENSRWLIGFDWLEYGKDSDLEEIDERRIVRE